MNMDKRILALIAALAVALASYVNSLPDPLSWARLAEVKIFFGFIGISGGVVGAWLSKSPMSGNRDGDL